ncbi:hypothetical protein BSKO_12342 [Bryopsis sp. KO-2023]|nr:hypothetical protein BSKO_12342 [Bryopsis sp. KO-2023]
MSLEDLERCPSACCAFVGGKRVLPWRITLRYRLANPGAEDVSINFVDSTTGRRTHPVWVRSLTDGKRKGRDYHKTVYGRFPRSVVDPETAILTETADVPFSLFVVAVKISSPFKRVRIPCFSWVTKAQGERIFLGGVPRLPKDVPAPVYELQKAELEVIRTRDGKTRSGNERIFDYDVYNDLGQPEGPLKRAILGGSKESPFPRRLRTGRPLASDGKTETRDVDLFWVPEDDAFAPEKAAGVSERQAVNLDRAAAAVRHYGGPRGAFTDIDNVSEMYDPAPSGPGFPLPRVYENRPDAWKTDKEFGRQRIAGMNPSTIEAINALPKGSAISDLHVTRTLLEGETLSDRLKTGRMFIVDYSLILPLVGAINSQPGLAPRFLYASRCLLYAKNDGGLIPVAIELMLPCDSGAISEVYTPKNSLTEWTLAKANFASLDFGVHELYSHFTRCHGCTEPYLIATRRNVSSSHPLYRLLLPHFKDTLSINSGARKDLIAAGGNIEQLATPGAVIHDVLGALYSKLWRFKTEGLPADLIKRKMAKARKGGDWRAGDVELVLKDYPYAEDGLLIWSALHKWVSSYLSLYYKYDSDVLGDVQLQGWWEEIKNEGHPDLVAFGIASEEEVWPELKNASDLTYILVTIMWVASGHHAAVNFGQYDYSGYVPNIPSYIALPMPKPETIKTDPDVLDEQAFLRTIAPPILAAGAASVVETLSTHGEGEEFLGDEIPHWLVDRRAEIALGDFRREIQRIEKRIGKRNRDGSNPARFFPYTLLIPNLPKGVGVPSATGRGIPNSISI